MKDKNLRPPLAAALALLLLGLALLAWPDVLLKVLPPLIGVVLILVGAQFIISTLLMGSRVKEPSLRFLSGFVNILVGAVFILKRDVSLLFMSVLFGLYVLVSAGIGLSVALAGRQRREAWLPAALESLLELVLGALLLFSPFNGLTLWVRVLGVYFVVAAAGMLWALAGLKKREDENEAGGDAGEE